MFQTYTIEMIYISAFLITCLSAMLLARWTIKRLILFIVIVMVTLVVARTARKVMYEFYPPPPPYFEYPA